MASIFLQTFDLLLLLLLSASIRFNLVQLDSLQRPDTLRDFLCLALPSIYLKKRPVADATYALYIVKVQLKSLERETHSTDVVLFPFPTNYLQTPPRLCVKTASGPTSSFSFYQPNYNQIHTHTQKVN